MEHGADSVAVRCDFAKLCFKSLSSIQAPTRGLTDNRLAIVGCWPYPFSGGGTWVCWRYRLAVGCWRYRLSVGGTALFLFAVGLLVVPPRC